MNRIRSFSTLILAACLVGLVVGATSCNLMRPQTTGDPTMDVTQAFQTVSVRLTQAIALTPSPLPPTTAAPSPTPQPTATSPDPVATTPSPSASPTVGIACDVAAPGNPIDVTIEDDTLMQPGQRFTKTWRLVNAGACTWTREYRAVWFSGEKLGDTLSVPLTDNVAPGGVVLITVDMIAPDKPGTYRSNWKFENASGQWFGIGLPGSEPVYPFYVQIVVQNPPTSTAPPPSPTPSPTVTTTATPPPTPTPTVTLTSVPSPTPVVLISGPTVLAPGDSLDLDSNTPNPSSGQDLSYQVDSSSYHWLTPENGASFGVFGNGVPNPGACQATSLGSAPIAIESISPGIVLCYRTDQSHSGWLRYDSFTQEDSSIHIQILTWSQP